MKEKFGAQGTSEQIRNVEENILTEDQKRMSDDRAATLERGFAAGKEFMIKKKQLDEAEAMGIFKEGEAYDVEVYMPSGIKRKIYAQIDDLSVIESGHLRVDGEYYPLSAVAEVVDVESLEVLWKNDEETYDGFATKQGGMKK